MQIKKSVAKCALAIIGVLALLTFLFFAVGTARAAEFRWRHFGVDPYATSRAVAMRTREDAFEKLGFPRPIVALLMEATKKPGEKTRVLVGDHLAAMLSKGGIVHHDVLVDFGSPVPRMQFAAPAEKWQVSWRGKIYTVLLPDICNNWSSIAPSLEACATVDFVVKPGDEVRFAALVRKYLPASACWQVCDGAVCTAPPSPCDDCNWIGPKSVIPPEFEPLHTGRYIAHAVKQSIRYPREIMSGYVALCVTRKGLGESDSWIVQPSAWKNGTVDLVSVPYDGQEWPAWGKVDLSKWRSAH